MLDVKKGKKTPKIVKNMVLDGFGI